MTGWLRVAAAMGLAVVLTVVSATAGVTYTLSSAQVVTSTTRPPVLRLRASGPVAYSLVTPAEAGVPESPGTIAARLYGVSPDPGMTTAGLAPFRVTVSPTEDGLLLVVSAAVADGLILELGTGSAASELEVRLVTGVR